MLTTEYGVDTVTKSKLFDKYLPYIRRLSKQHHLTKSDLLTDELLLEREGDLTMYYAPHNEYINKHAQVVIVGITPGWQQMRTAYEEIIQHLNHGDSSEHMLKKAKIAASFSGHMRTNLINMLDQCKLSEALNIRSTAHLFTTHRSYLHTTSVIKYPVFYKGKNYTGHTPTIERSLLLKHYAYYVFQAELAQINSSALIIPLGKVTEQVIRNIQSEQKEVQHTYLFGFPHPSGANGHRNKQFEQNHQQIESTIKRWANIKKRQIQVRFDDQSY